MESAGAMSELNLSSFDEMAPADGVGFMSQFLGSYPYANEQESDPSFGMPPLFWTGDEGMGIDEILSHCSLDMADFSSSYCLPQWNGSNLFIPTSNYESYYTSDANAIHPSNKSSATLDLSMVDELHTSSSIQVSPVNLLQEVFCLNEDMSNDIFGEMNANLSKPALLPNQSSQPKRKMRVQQSDKTLPDNNCSNNTCPSESPKKKSRVSCDVQTNGRNKHSRQKRRSFMAADEEGNSTALNGQSSSSCSSEDDSSASQELSGAAARNLNGKSRAGRGTATDPQSLYARKRRERINERLRILQNLVPNGTKVDISTMLEEAVQYVKFLQLQIKLLSSDDLWMYAPLAYNGMDIGLDLKISEGP